MLDRKGNYGIRCVVCVVCLIGVVHLGDVFGCLRDVGGRMGSFGNQSVSVGVIHFGLSLGAMDNLERGMLVGVSCVIGDV